MAENSEIVPVPQEEVAPASPFELSVDNHSVCLQTDSYDGFALSPGARRNLNAIVSSAHVGLVSAAPLICQGPGACPFVSRCPIYMSDGQGGTYPLRKQCIAEAAIIQERFVAYAEELNAEGRVMDSFTFRAQVSKLVELDLYEYRLSLILAGVAAVGDGDRENLDGSLLIDQVATITKDGTEIRQIAEHPAWKMKVKVQQQRMELLDVMGLTVRRKAAIDAALHRRNEDNYLSKSVELLEKIAALQESLGEK